jgi:hypothetical protein
MLVVQLLVVELFHYFTEAMLLLCAPGGIVFGEGLQ